MKKNLLIIWLYVSLSYVVQAQFFTDSNLPIIIINTDGGITIPDDPKVGATMKIIYRGPGERNYLTDQNNPAYLNYNGRIKIEVRGSSSQARPKKQYGFTTLMSDNLTNNNISLLGMPKENDWILNGMIFDPGLIRDYLSYNLSRQIGQYASRTEYCEVVINGGYRGLYVLQEKIKADDNRINIVKISPSDNLYPDVTGGYITKADKTTGGDPIAWTMISWFGTNVAYIHELPEPEDVTTAQNNYIQSQFTKLELTAFNSDNSIDYGFPSVIDIPSFIDHMILNELGSNADAYTYSAFFHKDRNGKLRAGPVWDLDLTYGNDLFFWGYDRSKPNVWQFSTGDNDGSRFWKDLFMNSAFKCYFSKRWNDLTLPGQPLYQANIESFIDQTVSRISEAANREYQRWGISGNFQQNISAIKSFLSARIPWITSNLGSFNDCSNVPLPPLIITKIMYNPSATPEFPDGEDLEFIEILNDGDAGINMTGIYFGGTGFVFQFPVNSVIQPHSSIILASNPTAFRTKYGFPAYGKFTRHLSDKSEDLVLLDAFGNVIDNVTYGDTIPWPDADANGSYLALIDPDLDNSRPENWKASGEILVSDGNVEADVNIRVYPNPVSEILRIESGYEIKTISLFDIYGRMLLTVEANSETTGIDMSSLPDGVFIIRIVTSYKTYTEKIIKN